MTLYADFLETKAQSGADRGFEPTSLPPFLFDFQTSLVEWGVRKGRAAIFADCGMGKTPMQLVWAENVYRETGRPVLLLAPLAVTFQTAAEAEKFGIDAAVSRDGRVVSPITITNYERLHLFDADDFDGAVCDESSILKSFDGETRGRVTHFLRKKPYRLLCTATAAPNDYLELGASSEALGELGFKDMLTRFFVNKDRTGDTKIHHRLFRGVDRGWRFKGHAEEPFWRWVASWARALRRPSDLGFDDDGLRLPPLEYRQHVVSAREPAPGRLFDQPAFGLREERAELRRTLTERCEAVADVLDDAERGVAWCHLNPEGDLLTKLIDGAVQVSGSDASEEKEAKLAAFTRGEVRVLVSKPTVAGWGLNWQHCHRIAYFPSHSYEQWYQAVRRCWRFGQREPVVVDVVTTEGMARALANLERKAQQADRMFDALVAHMRDAMGVQREREFPTPVEVPAWA